MSEEIKKSKPKLRLFKKDKDGKKIENSEIVLWENTSKDGKTTYLSGYLASDKSKKPEDREKYVGFLND